MVWYPVVLKIFRLIMARNKLGQSLVEVLASMTVVLFIVFGLFSLTTYSIKKSTFSKNQSLATKYAQEKLEEIRALRDRNPEEFWERTGTQIDTVDIFTREVIYEQIKDVVGEATESAVTVIVWWEDISGKHYSKLKTSFTKW